MIRTEHALLTVAGLTALALALHGSPAQGHDHDRDEHGEQDHDGRAYTIALFGDMPYGPLGKQQYPALLADVNAHHVAFSVFDGDLKAGGDGPCSDENLYFPALAHFAQLDRPLIFVPGDNDKVDPEKRNLQRPRVFYRREVEAHRRVA